MEQCDHWRCCWNVLCRVHGLPDAGGEDGRGVWRQEGINIVWFTWFVSILRLCQVLAAAMGGVATLTLLIPSAAKLGGHTGYPYYLVIIRVLMGLCEAATFPCITSMLARWAPEQERATMSTFIMAGSQVKDATTNQLFIRPLTG